jgi:hypothetical protein
MSPGWYVASRSVIAHYVDPRQGHLRVVYVARCGRQARTWEPESVRQTYRCADCEDATK